MKNIKLLVLVLFLLAVLALAILYVMNDLKDVGTEENTTGINAETEDDLPYEIQIVPTQGINIPLPDLAREVNFDKATEKTRNEIRVTHTALKAAPTKFSLWIDLSSLRKSIGDYEGARLVLEYLTRVAPDNGIAHRNLADLYAFYLKDNVKAEQNILLAIEKDPEQIEYYFKAVEIYRVVMKNMTKARAIVEQGIKANSDSVELKELAQSLK